MKHKFFIIAAIFIFLVIAGWVYIPYYSKNKLPPSDEYGFWIETTSGDYITNEIAFYEGYLVLEDYYKVYPYPTTKKDRGDHHTNTLLLSGDKITITSRVEGED